MAACAVACGQKLAQTATKFGKVCSFAAPILAVVSGYLNGSQIFLQEEIERKSWATPFLVAVSGFPIW